MADADPPTDTPADAASTERPRDIAMDAATAAALDAAQHVTVRSLLLGTGPRFARDAFGPLLAFYVGLQLSGVLLGVVLCTLGSLAAVAYERRQERSGRLAYLTLGFVLVQAVVGVISRDAEIFLSQQVLLTAAFGFAFLISAAIGRPLAGTFADEMYPFPAEVRASVTFRRVFSRISIAWGVYQLARAGVRMLVLWRVGVEEFILVNLITGAPLMIGMMSWSVWYGVRGFKRSEEWGWAMAGMPPPTAPV